MNISIYFILAAVFILSFFLSPFSIWYSNKLLIVDVANHRSSHEGITPRGGGIVFIIVFFMGLAGYFLLEGIPDSSLLVILFCALIMAIVGWLDDFKDLSVKIRFLVQFLTVSVSCLWLPRIWPAIPLGAERIVIILAWIWFINLFNFMDGTDGYAVQEAVLICAGLFILSSASGNIALILACSVLGFLRVNYPKAKIFMGDVGSIFLGYILGGLIIHSIAEHSMTIIQAGVLTSLFSVDATYTLLKRMLQKKKVWQAHREHWYQILNITGAGHKEIFYIGAVYNLFIAALLFLDKSGTIGEFTLLVITLIILCSIAFYIRMRFKKYQLRQKIHEKTAP